MDSKRTLEFNAHGLDGRDLRQALNALRNMGPAVVAILLVLLTTQGWAGRHKQSAKTGASSDPAYVLALGAANRFLHAWETGDLETGMVLLSDRVRHASNPDSLEDFFSAGRERGFEIMRGSGRAGRYRFPVALLSRQGNTSRRVATEIILVSTGRNEWAVDKLP